MLNLRTNQIGDENALCFKLKLDHAVIWPSARICNAHEPVSDRFELHCDRAANLSFAAQ